MKKVSFEGFGAQCATFHKADGVELQKGDFVAISANGTVSKATSGEIIGICIDVCGDLVTTQLKGYMRGKYVSGQSVQLGKCHLGLDSNGKIKILATAPTVVVTDIDTVNNEIGFII